MLKLKGNLSVNENSIKLLGIALPRLSYQGLAVSISTLDPVVHCQTRDHEATELLAALGITDIDTIRLDELKPLPMLQLVWLKDCFEALWANLTGLRSAELTNPPTSLMLDYGDGTGKDSMVRLSFGAELLSEAERVEALKATNDRIHEILKTQKS